MEFLGDCRWDPCDACPVRKLPDNEKPRVSEAIEKVEAAAEDDRFVIVDNFELRKRCRNSTGNYRRADLHAAIVEAVLNRAQHGCINEE